MSLHSGASIFLTFFYLFLSKKSLKGIDTNPLWRNIYTAKWRRKSKWPEVYFKAKGITREQELWKIYYLQRLLQEALNECNVSGLKICSSSAGTK